MRARWINPYFVLLTGYLIGASISVAGMVGVFAYMAWSHGIWPWQGISRVLIGAVWPCGMQLLPFALLAAGALAARSLDQGRVVTIVVLSSAFGAAGVNIVLLGDGLVSETVIANHLLEFLRDHPGTIVDRFDGGMPATILHATAKTLLLSLILALASVVTAILARLVRWVAPQWEKISIARRAAQNIKTAG